MPAHRLSDSAWILFASDRGDGETRVGASHSLQRHAEHHDTAPVHSLRDLVARYVGPERDLVENSALNLMVALLISARRPALLVRQRHHRRVLSRAIVVKARRPVARF